LGISNKLSVPPYNTFANGSIWSSPAVITVIDCDYHVVYAKSMKIQSLAQFLCQPVILEVQRVADRKIP
jgi:hypothetical protein